MQCKYNHVAQVAERNIHPADKFGLNVLVADQMQLVLHCSRTRGIRLESLLKQICTQMER